MVSSQCDFGCRSDLDELFNCSHGRVVAFATASDLAFGMSRMFSVFAENGAVKVSAFRTMGEARAWIAGELALPPASSTRTL